MKDQPALTVWAKVAKGGKGSPDQERDDSGRFGSGSGKSKKDAAPKASEATSADDVDDTTLGETLSERGVTSETGRMDRLGVIREAFPKMGMSDHMRLNRRATEALGGVEEKRAWEVGREQRGGHPGGVAPVGEIGTRASNRASRTAARAGMRKGRRR